MIAYRYNAGRAQALPVPKPTSASAGSSLLLAMQRASERHGISVTRIGREAVNDPNLFGDLRSGSSISEKRAARVRAFLSAFDGEV